MIFLIGGLVVGIGLMLQIIQFYRGQRREFYLLYGRAWTFVAGLGSSMVMVCCVGMVTEMVSVPGSTIALLLCVSPTFWLLISLMFLLVPPVWLREFERDRTPFEIMLAINNAQVLLRTYPRTFRQAIRQRDGWELWLLSLGTWLELDGGSLDFAGRQRLRDALAAPQ